MTELTSSADGPWQSATVMEIIPRTPRIKSFMLKLSRPFAFLAGQHVDLRLTAPDGYRAMRSYSIASAPGDSGTIELAIEYMKDGEVSPFFHDVVVVGDEIELRGPLGGYFNWMESEGGPLVLVGGGSGVVPLMSMIRHRHAIGSKIPFILLLSARHWEDVLYRDELIELHDKADGFVLALTFTREPPRRKTDYGRHVDAAMIKDILARLPAPPKFIYVCGTNAFVNSAADGAVDSGIAASIIRTERYGT
ncbi:MAG TPA: FAD-binding oxidoreductase [Rhizomicrobium sp.]|nr:FAD-binding oxidoreductase [Rhizomicrobium sp.]